MRKHLYFNSSNLEYLPHLREDENFTPLFEYLEPEKKYHSYEWGMIKTPSLFLHFIMGNPPQDGCAWCNGVIELLKINKEASSDPFHKLMFCMQCQSCGSRGPILFISPDALLYEKDTIYMENI